MKQRTGLILAFASLLVSAEARAQKLDLELVEQSVRYINDLQNNDGGFGTSASDRASDLGATTTALRALKYLHPEARPRNRESPKEFVLKCYHPETGSFSLKPGQEHDVRSTAMGLMAMAELKMPVANYAKAIDQYFATRANSLPDIYIATAALHSAELPASKAAEWIASYEATRGEGGRYGNAVVETAGAVNTILRLGGSLQNRAATAAYIRASQLEDGGFAKPGSGSDLATTYRMMRALWMLKERPNLERCRGFLARCRNDDGGYGVEPGKPSSVSATYYAAIVLHWLEELERR